MGRHEKAVVASTRQLEDLALWLRAQRQDRGLTYAQMAKTSTPAYTSTAFSRAASGNTVPTWNLTEAYAKVCGADLRTAHRLWRAARWAEHRSRQEARADGQDIAAKWYDVLATQLRLISDYVSLRRAMIGLRAKGGQPSLAQLQKQAGRSGSGGWCLPASSLGAILRGEAVPDVRHVLAFVRAMGDGRREAEWVAAWNRAERGGTIPTPWSWYQVADAPGFEQAPKKSTLSFRVSVLTPVPAPGTEAAAGQIPTGALTNDDRHFLHSHGLTVHEADENGPVRHLPFGGYTPAGLPIRAPRRAHTPRWTAGPTPP
ncbi:helix-turn-helix domain-containing protein [Kitasatospora cineracea]|uniref:helix-turn-helix domain-containing protein n=1 Tax=Kitasatospora cineracea TaxID=88074 RepID=UPI0037AF8132